VADVAQFRTTYDEVSAEVQQRSSEHSELVSLAQQLAAEGVSENTYSEYTVQDIDQRWQAIQQAVQARGAALEAEHAKQEAHEELRKKWAHEAQGFADWCAQKEQEVKAQGDNTADLQASVDGVKKILEEVSGHQHALDALAHLAQELDDAEITENPHTTLTLETVKVAFDTVVGLGTNTIKVLENEILLKAHSGVSEEELAEFKKSFDHFDKDHSGQLNKLELKSCLQSLGEDTKEEELEKIFTQFGITIEEKGENVKVLPFQSFVAYMLGKHGDSDNLGAIKEAFKVMAGDKAFITERDLRAVLPNDKVDHLLTAMPRYPGIDVEGYDYVAYASTLYA
jgi:actinin alpha